MSNTAETVLRAHAPNYQRPEIEKWGAKGSWTCKRGCDSWPCPPYSDALRILARRASQARGTPSPVGDVARSPVPFVYR